jgi:hypothetical protein
MARSYLATGVATLSFAALAACTPSQFDKDPSNGPDAGADPGADAECPGVNFTAEPLVPSISLLIDRSGSMANSIGNTTRYRAVRDALVGPSGVVTELENKAHFGASLYTTDSPCPRLYSVPRALGNRAAIEQLINSQNPGGNTPTAASIDQAVAAFAAAPPPADSPPVIVLATDGLPNSCTGGNGEAATVTAARSSFAAGIRLFVLAVGSGINDGHLRAVANAGAGVQAGEPNAPFFVANTPQELRSAFDQIISSVVSCELQIDGTIDESQAQAGTVTLDGIPLQFGVDWELVNGNVIRLLGQACTTLKSSPNPMVTATFPCGAVLL